MLDKLTKRDLLDLDLVKLLYCFEHYPDHMQQLLSILLQCMYYVAMEDRCLHVHITPLNIR